MNPKTTLNILNSMICISSKCVLTTTDVSKEIRLVLFPLSHHQQVKDCIECPIEKFNHYYKNQK